MEKEELIYTISKSLAINLPGHIQYDDFVTAISEYINKLIGEDFEKLVSLLYRIDVSEYKLKNLLQENPGEDAGRIIAALIIERQEQKIETRKQFRQKNNDIAEDEKW